MTTIADFEAESFRVIGGRADAGLIVLCDHASNALPPEYGSLGLSPAEFDRHIAYDIGAEGVARAIAEAFGAPAVMTRYSRLLIDPNRGLDDPTLIMRLSDGAIVPGNRDVDDTERDLRIQRYWAPYHRAIDEVITACVSAGVAPTIVSVHSFTEAWKGVPRPWHVGILWDRDGRLAQPLIDALAAEPDLVVGDNQPYKGSLEGDCMWQHATQRGLMHALIEVRQDLIADVRSQAEWGARLSDVLDRLRGCRGLERLAPRRRPASGPTTPGQRMSPNVRTEPNSGDIDAARQQRPGVSGLASPIRETQP
jgi:predicted N-formylglutamate amidohydrolase